MNPQSCGGHWFRPNFRANRNGLGCRQNTEAQEIEVGASIHGAFNHFETINVALDPTVGLTTAVRRR